MHPIVAPLAILFAASTLYAVILRQPTIQEWTAHFTWTAVVAGVALVLVALALYSVAVALLATVFFVVAGIPIVVGELVEEFQAKRALMQRSMDK